MRNVVKKITAAVITAEGLCASIVVDEALKAVKCNKVVKWVGRGMVSTMIATYTTSLAVNALLDGDDDHRHTVSIDAPHSKKIKMKYAPGEVVTISADGMLRPGEDFMYWHTDSENVEFEDCSSPTTTFIMPAEKVKISFAYGFGMANAQDENMEEPMDDDMGITNVNDPAPGNA